jgi:hypothetical protein
MEEKARVVQLTRAQLYTIVGGAIVAGALACAIAAYFKSTAAGDEPPIRVRGGSIELHIDTSEYARWEPEQTTWHLLSYGFNFKDEYSIKIIQNGGSCTGTLPTAVKKVRIKHPGEDITITSVAWKTKVDTQGNFSRISDKHIEYKGADDAHVEAIWVHGPGSGQPYTCTYAGTQFQALCLCVDPQDCSKQCP